MYITIPGLTGGMGSSKTRFAAFPAQYAEMHAAKTRGAPNAAAKLAQLRQIAQQVKSVEDQVAQATAMPSDPFSFAFSFDTASSESAEILADIDSLAADLNAAISELRSIGNTGSGDLNADQAKWGLGPNATVDYIGKHHEDMYAAWDRYSQVKDKIVQIEQAIAKHQSKLQQIGRAASAELARAQAEQRRAQEQARAQELAQQRAIAEQQRQEQAALQAEQRRMQAELDAENRRIQAEMAREQAMLNAQLAQEQARAQAEAAREQARLQAEMQVQQQRLAMEQQRAQMEAQVAAQKAALEQQKLQAELAAQYPDVYGPQAQAVQQQAAYPQYQMPTATMYMPTTSVMQQTQFEPGVRYADLPADWMQQTVPSATLPQSITSLPQNWTQVEAQSLQAQQTSSWWNPGGSAEMFGMPDTFKGMGGMGADPSAGTSAGDTIRNLFSQENVEKMHDIAATVAPKYVPARVDPEAEKAREADAARAKLVNAGLTVGAIAAAVWVGSKVLKR